MSAVIVARYLQHSDYHVSSNCSSLFTNMETRDI